jgi:long-chain acyl-CoA synthetase
MNNVRHAEQKRFERLMQSITKNGKLMTLGHLLEWASLRYGYRTALICEDQEISYTDLFRRSCMFSERLKAAGVKPGDCVLVWLENSIELYVAYFGALQVGAVVSLLNAYLTERELTHIIADAKAAVLVSEKHFAERLQQVSEQMSVLYKEEAIVLSEPVIERACKVYDKGADELTVLLYTSGTTGLPKGVMLSSRNALTNAMQGIARQEFKQCRMVCVLPLFHSFAQNTCIWMALLYGCTVIIVPKIERRYILRALEKKPAIFLGVPALYGLLCLMKTAPIGDVELFVAGGDALPDKIRSAFALIYNRHICNGYGLTETSPLISIDLDDIVEQTNCVGVPCIDTAIEIRAEDARVLPTGRIGRLWVKGPQVMLGYYNAPESTAAVLQNQWFDTGDLAYINKRGKIVIAGREKDLIINKGFNIYPQEIENVLLGHPDVLRAAVIGKEDPAGEVPIAVVQVRNEHPSTEAELKKRCREQLAAYKVPKEIKIYRTDLPLTATGKVNKKELKKQLYGNESH